MTTHVPMPVPGTDPLPWLTDRYRMAGAFERERGGALTQGAVTAMRATLQSIVTGLQDDEHVFRAVFGKTATAATDLKSRLVYLGTKAMQDPSISEGRLAAIMTGLAYHEVGHINHDRAYETFVTRTLMNEGHPHVKAAHDVHNIGQDVRLEVRMARALPGYAPTLPVTLWYMTKSSRVTSMPPGIDKSAARNLFFAAVRAPWTIDDWTGWEDALAWGQDWARRFAATDKRATVLDLVREALDTIVAWSERAPTEVKPPTEPPVGPPPDDDDPQPPDDTIDPPNPWDDDEEEPPEGDDESPQPPPDPDADDEEPEDPYEPPTGYEEPEDDEDPEDEEPGGDDEEPEDETPEDDKPGGETQVFSDEHDVEEPPEGDDTVEQASADDVEEPPVSTGIEDLEFPACSNDAMLTVSDTGYDLVATRVEKTREENGTRVYRHDGWPSRTVKRVWDWNGDVTDPR